MQMRRRAIHKNDPFRPSAHFLPNCRRLTGHGERAGLSLALPDVLLIDFRTNRTARRMRMDKREKSKVSIQSPLSFYSSFSPQEAARNEDAAASARPAESPRAGRSEFPPSEAARLRSQAAECGEAARIAPRPQISHSSPHPTAAARRSRRGGRGRLRSPAAPERGPSAAHSVKRRRPIHRSALQSPSECPGGCRSEERIGKS